MSTINNYVYGSSWYDQYKYASNVQSKREKAFSTSTEINTQQVSPLQSLIDSGTITEDQEEAIKSAMESAIQSSSYSRFKIQSDSTSTETKDPLAILVENGTITEEQKSSVESLLKSGRKGDHVPPPPPQNNTLDSFESTLDNLVSAGTISEDQKSEVLNALNSAFEAGFANKDTSSSSNENDPLDALVEAGTITEDQKAAIINSFEENIKGNKTPPPPKDDENSFDTILDSLVSDGTITEDQKNSILEKISSQSETETSNTDSSSSSSYEAYINGLSELVNAFKVAVNAYETQFEAGQEDNTESILEVAF